jgi:tetratricopeptide (TPR) repeat protein
MAEKSRALIKFGVALGVVWMLSGCHSAAVRPTPESTRTAPPSAPGLPPSIPTPPAPAQQRPQQPSREIRLSPATQSLVTQAHGLLSHGDMDGASSTLDRALRIEPNNPLLWIELGRVRLVESDSHQAESCGRKALALAGGDKAAQAQSGRLLVDALRAQERNQEAQEVESQPFMH